VQNGKGLKYLLILHFLPFLLPLRFRFGTYFTDMGMNR
jgi:hypothetical protein